jgi:organic radical activating enzyme
MDAVGENQAKTPDETDRFSPFVAGHRETCATAFANAIQDHLGPHPLEVEVLCGSGGGSGPMRVVVRNGGAVVALLVSEKTGPALWSLGKLKLTVARQWKGQRVGVSAESKALLTQLGDRIARPLSPDHATALFQHYRQTQQAMELKDRFYRHIEDGHYKVQGFLRVGFGCNQNCFFCWQGRTWPTPPKELVFKWLDEFHALGVQHLKIEGGEPLIWPHLDALAERAHHKYGMEIHLNTNAIALSRKGVVDRLKTLGVNSLLVSLHDADPVRSDKLTKAQGTHKRTVAGIHQALAGGLRVMINCLVLKENIDHLPQHAQFIVDEFIGSYPENPVLSVEYSNPGPFYDSARFDASILPYDQVQPGLLAAVSILHSADVLLELGGTCGFPPCLLKALPEALPWRQRSTMDAGSVRARDHDLEVCAGCLVADQCIGPRREYTQQFGGLGLVPFDYIPQSDWYARFAQRMGAAQGVSGSASSASTQPAEESTKASQ